MPSELVIGLLGVVATLNVAAIAALGWLINFTVSLDRSQTESRVVMARDLAARSESDHAALVLRLERIEDRLNHSQIVRYAPRRNHDGC